ncbi:MAG: phosphohydrolase [Firmicutes bacterium GWF2_51_9]|nr:MAG: phosphohydrolase [Firmicutes bacterium GWF2_51_9]OGS58184.1 MAG: phosphohydrolase [Firmicutes bacterium GWE2_51_13]HAM63563.1 phosphohydrolase [Erysipelotrichaceae bacterium]HAO60915.1 phosphohydrolase [Erysipelotrichaceae bacterium]HBZ42161.1 phosphohydrolase [Erysipelotrichaceae bacterium]
MFGKLNEVKVLRDPIHEYIHIEYQVIWDCLNSPEFQRLRRIHQLGATHQVYHAAEHSRFSHSLGVYEIVRRMVNEVEGLKEALSEEEQIEVMLAGMLHDIGHGPFSHSFESVLDFNHETMGALILMGESTIHDVLVSHHPDLPKNIVDILQHKHSNPILNQVVSGQLDADRMDYLLRDAYFTGTSYGTFDLERVLRTLRLHDDKLVVKESGVHTIEDYIMARYHMYWQVYYHPVSRSFETILVRFFKRLVVLNAVDPGISKRFAMFGPFFHEGYPTLKEHFELDEAACLYAFTLARKESDEILKDLGTRLMDRRLFEYAEVESPQQIAAQRQNVIDAGLDPEYYFALDMAVQRPYSPYQEKENSLIWILNTKNEIKELSQASVLVGAIVRGENKKDEKMYFPRETAK